MSWITTATAANLAALSDDEDPLPHPEFWRRLEALLTRLPSISIVSLGRSRAKQEYLYNCYLTKQCNSGNPANPPGRSFHEARPPHGFCLAADLDNGPYDWGTVWAVAADVDIHFPIRSREPWHCQPVEVPSASTCDGCVAPAPFDTEIAPPPPPDPLELKGRTNMLIASQVPGYMVQNRLTGEVLDVPNGAVQDGVRVDTFVPNGGPNQRLYLDGWDVSRAVCRLVFQHSGRVLDVLEGRRNNGAPVGQWPWTGGAKNQLWKVEYVGVDPNDGSHYYRIRSEMDGGFVLDASPNGDGCQIWTPHNGLNQHWRFQP